MDDDDYFECGDCGEFSPLSDVSAPDWPDDIPDVNPQDFLQCPHCLVSRFVG